MKIKDLRQLIKEELENVIIGDYINESIDELDDHQLKNHALNFIKILSSPNKHVTGRQFKIAEVLAGRLYEIDPRLAMQLRIKLRQRKFKI